MPDLAINPVGSAIPSDVVCTGAVAAVVVVVVDNVLKMAGLCKRFGSGGRRD